MNKIFFISFHPAPYRDSVLEDFTKRFSEDNDLSVLYLDYIDKGHSYQSLINLSCRVFNDPNYRGIKDKIHLLNLVNPDVIVIPGYKTIWFIISVIYAKLFKKKLIYTADTINFENLPFKSFVRSVIIRFISFIFDSAFVSGFSSVEFFSINGFSSKKVLNGAYTIDVDKFKIEAIEYKKNRSEIRNSIGLNDNDHVFIYSGRSIEIRNLNSLVLAYNKLYLSYPNIKLILIGNKAELEIISLSMIPSSYIICDSIAIDKIGKYYAVSDCYVLPSYYETYSVTLIHAACYGVNIVSSCNVGANEDLKLAGYSLYEFNPYSLEDLYNALEKSLLNKETHNHLNTQLISINNGSNNLKSLIDFSINL